jgi:hypothetical protein
MIWRRLKRAARDQGLGLNRPANVVETEERDGRVWGVRAIARMWTVSSKRLTCVSHFLSKDFTGFCGLFLHVTSVVVFENESVT